MLHGYFDIPTFHYFEEKNTWSGSNYTNFSYRIDPVLGDEKELYVRVWYGTKCVTEVTDFVAEYHEEYSEKGLENVLADLTKEFEKFKLIRKELSDFSAALELPEIGGFSAAKLEKHEITTDDFDGTRDVKIVYANLIDGKVDEKYDGLNLSLSYYQRLDKTTVDDMLDMYAKSADISSDDNVWLDYRGLDLGNGKRGCVIAALGEDQSVNVQGIYEFSDSEYIQYNVVIPLKYVSMGEDIFDSAMSFRYAE